MTGTTLAREDLEPLLASHTGNDTFAHVLETVDTGAPLLRVLSRYIYFNATFGAGVAHLAGELGIRQDLFIDKEEPVALFADRSMDVASDIFAAAVDEFDDSATPYRDTHRSLAQATLKAATAFFGYENSEQLNTAIALNTATRTAVSEARTGYGIGKTMDEPTLFRCLGFHIGSELLADEEFRSMDGILRRRFPDLVSHLENTSVKIAGQEHAAYFWVHIHTSVEADHFAYAVRGANQALAFYAGERSPEAAKADIITGIQEFAAVQTALMDSLAN